MYRNDMAKRFAVIGGGIFGCTTAIELARAGYRVVLFEKAQDIMTAASAINQYRLHRGYHYPRSSETIFSCLEATPLFEEEYKEAVIAHHSHYYAIAKEGSRLTGAEYLAVLERHNLPYEVVMPAHLNADLLDVAIRAEENLYDPHILRKILVERLRDVGVEVQVGRSVDVDELDDFDQIIVATYAALNDSYKQRLHLHREYQFEVCEKIVVEIPEFQKGISTVVMDGPFMSFDPWGETGYAVMGHVEHAIHHRSFGHRAEVPEQIAHYLNRGLIENPEVSNAHMMIEASVPYMPLLKDARHVGSMYTIRTVLPRVDHTDERPTIVNAIDDRIITIYSGKVGNSVKAARDVLECIHSKFRSQ